MKVTQEELKNMKMTLDTLKKNLDFAQTQQGYVNLFDDHDQLLYSLREGLYHVAKVYNEARSQYVEDYPDQESVLNELQLDYVNEHELAYT